MNWVFGFGGDGFGEEVVDNRDVGRNDVSDLC